MNFATSDSSLSADYSRPGWPRSLLRAALRPLTASEHGVRRLISAWGIFPIFQPRRDDQIRANPPARPIRLPGTPDAHTGSTIHGDLNARDSAPRSAFEPRAPAARKGAPGDAVPGRAEPNGGGLGGGQAVRLVGWPR